MTDTTIVGQLSNLGIAFSYTRATVAANEIVFRQGCDPIAAHLLGRCVAAGTVLAAGGELDENVNICWQYGGLLQTIVVDAARNGDVRALVSPRSLSEATGEAEVFGEEGRVRVLRMADGDIRNSGTAETALQEPIADLAHFLSVSDQVETGIIAMIRMTPNPEAPIAACHGLLVHSLPGSDLERFDRVRARLASAGLRDAFSMPREADGYMEDLLLELWRDETADPGLTIDSRPPPLFHCPCSREKLADVVRTLPYKDRMDVVQKKEPLALRCQFCGAAYAYSIEECIVAWNRDRPAR